MFGLGKVARARRAAVAAISPLVDLSRHRLGAIPVQAWRDPYVIGFMAMLITLFAKDETEGRIGSEQLGLAQTEAWARITGERDDLIGQEICLLSNRRNADFGEGCSNALQFMKAFHGEQGLAGPHMSDISEAAGRLAAEADAVWPEHVDIFGKGGVVAAALWTRFFEERVR
ncbi:MAG: hypothetical protein ACR2PO_18125 [Methyloligellaceae bacterium]